MNKAIEMLDRTCLKQKSKHLSKTYLCDRGKAHKTIGLETLLYHLKLAKDVLTNQLVKRNHWTKLLNVVGLHGICNILNKVNHANSTVLDLYRNGIEIAECSNSATVRYRWVTMVVILGIHQLVPCYSSEHTYFYLVEQETQLKLCLSESAVSCDEL